MNSQNAGATVLITGGTGSFGHAMTRRLLASGCGEVRVLSRDEAKQDAMRRRLDDGRLRFYLGDVRDPAAVHRACRGVDYVFHAAALKQVPSCEFFPMEAVQTNVVGSANVVDAARAAGVTTVVCLSTDKAVYPINAMGLSKAMMEKIVQAQSRGQPASEPVFCVVRYGNVLFSRGSILPVFLEQAATGRPFTVTDPRMTRFLMSLDDAVSLVEHAFTAAGPGDTFVRKAPASTIDALARAVADIFEVVPAFEMIGARHGEKRHETLVSREEAIRAEDQGEYFRVPLDVRGLDYHRFFDQGEPALPAAAEYASHNAEQLDVEAVGKVLRQTAEVQDYFKARGKEL